MNLQVSKKLHQAKFYNAKRHFRVFVKKETR